MSHHKVHIFKWVDGVLKWREYTFGTKHEAVNWASTVQDTSADSIKVMDHEGTIVHEISPTAINTQTYA